MPNIKSAKKRMRQNEKRRMANRAKKSAVRTAEKKLRKAIQAGNLEEAKEHYRVFTSLIDRAAKRNIFHKNTAARKKSRLAKLISKAEQN
ncbi:MAG: 30S ribosomal protein S20 [Candidatus Hydrogenedentota bacterium]|nr:MAG: 30S ribosomal protein S20 [Candidatus Hydrogenedentota bacterium]